MEKEVRVSFLLSLLLHLLFFLTIAIMMKWRPIPQKKSADDYTPAYVYKGSAMLSALSQNSSAIKQTDVGQKAVQKRTQHGIAKPSASVRKTVGAQSVLAMTYQFLQNNTLEKSKEDPIYLVGDDKTPADPLIRLLARALSAHFSYPHEAAVLGIRGKAIVGMTLHPGGRLTDIELLASADDHRLDSAALYAVKKAPIVRGAEQYLTKPAYFVIGFIFR